MKDHRLGTSKQAMSKIKREVGVGFAGIDTTLGREFGEVINHYDRVSISVFASGGCKKLLNIPMMDLTLIRTQRCILALSLASTCLRFEAWVEAR